MRKKVIIGLSGGVDSAVSAYLLKKKGYDVEAVFMNNWDSFINGEINNNLKNEGCNNKNDLDDAIKCAKFLDIKIHTVNFIDEYWNQVFLKFIEKYKKGITPNPDILCNKFIKFEIFRKYIFKNFKANFFAFGHYANVKKNLNGSFDLIVAKDAHKDQTYFLCELNQEQIEKVIFPIGNYLKNEVRNIAKKINLPIWNKKDSTGICFIGKRNFKDFISNYIEIKKGKIIDINTRKIIGEHDSASYFTIGQSKNIGILNQNKKYYVCEKDIDNNILYVSNDLDKIKNFNSIEIEKFNWINESKFDLNIKVRYRHCGKLYNAKIINGNKLKIIFEEDQKLIALGQYAVAYYKNICLGGGEITKILFN